MSAQAPATNNVAPSADQANQVQSQEVEAPQNAQTQQPQASTSNIHKLLQHQLNQKHQKVHQ